MTAVSPEFVFIICCTSDDLSQIPQELFDIMHVFRIVDKQAASKADDSNNASTSVDPEMEAIAALYGAGEIIR
jgi:hypothetical protein